MIKFKWPKWLQTAATPSMQIGIDGLTALAGCLQVGSQYLVTAVNSRARMALVINTVRAAIASGHSCVVVSSEPERLSEKLQQAGVALAGRRDEVGVQLLKRLPHTEENLKIFGYERWLSELEEVDLHAASLLIIEDADCFFDWQHAAQLQTQTRRYRQWLHDWQVAGLFLLTAPASEQLPAHVANNLQLFAGVAEFANDLGGYCWQIKHWYSAYGPLLDAEFTIQNADSGTGLVVVQGLSAAPVLPGDELQVYYTADVLDADESLPDDWIRCLSYLDLLALAPRLGMASVILHYGQQSAFPLLAQTVHQLRFLAGRQMRIIIRERGGQLRYSQELLLTRLGANQIVYREFGVSRLLRSVESSLGHRFTGYIEEDFEQALTAAMPSEECGYLPPGKFCELVKSTLQKTEAIEMHHVLVRLDILAAKAHLDVLLNCQPRRANDIVTADEAHVYIFLFACREPDIDAALSRIVIEPLEQLFSGQSYWSGRWNILTALEELQTKSMLTGLADFSLLLPEAVPQHGERLASESATNAVNRRISPLHVAGELPPTAPRTVVRHALKLRS